MSGTQRPGGQGQPPLPEIDFAALAGALLDRAATLLPMWLPGGKVTGGREYTCHDLSGGEGGRLSVNLIKGVWRDFGGDDGGADLISLYAAIRGLKQGAAARELMQDMGWQAAEPPPRDPAPTKRRTMWRAQAAAPAHAPEPDFVWSYRDESKPDKPWVKIAAAMHWAYRRDGVLHGYVARINRIDSKGEAVKETLPMTWCVDESDSRGSARWKWQGWEQPRPLFLPSGQSPAPNRMIVLVEGEKCAQALHDAIQAEGHEDYEVISWPGGCKGWAKADWAWVPEGAQVICWPDADSDREPLSRSEREMGVRPETKPFKSAIRQGGMAAMLGIGAVLSERGCRVRVCEIERPGVLTHGWDVADALAEGWGVGRCLDFVANAIPLERVAEAYARDARLPAPAGARGESGPAVGAVVPPEQSPPSPGSAGDDESWRDRLIWRKGELVDCRENIFLLLAHHPALAGRVAYDEFAARVTKLAPMPWGAEVGEWSNQDDYALGLWLAEHCSLIVRAEGTLVAGVAMAAHAARFHPVRAYIDGLVWDGIDRLDHWLHECLSCADTSYHAMVGRWYVMGMVQRILVPGCQMDNMIILEGAQGRRKSSALRTLSKGWFADTPIRIGDKDALLNLAGVWLYEVGELDAFSKAEVTAVKQYVTSRVDRVREPFARRAVDRPRSCVLGGSTNQSEYFKDSTGSRRFWPVRITEDIDLARLAEWVDQMHAEAVVRLRAGERYYPTRDEEERYIVPEQESREITDPWMERISAWVDEISADGGAHRLDSNSPAWSYTTEELLRRCLHVPVDRIDGGRQMATRVGICMHKLGWSKVRDSKASPGGVRLWRYIRPGWSTEGRKLPSEVVMSNTRPTPAIAWLDDVTR